MTCENCGCRVYGGFCVNCDEEHFIAEQYREEGMPVPQAILDAELPQIESAHERFKGSKQQ